MKLSKSLVIKIAILGSFLGLGVIAVRGSQNFLRELQSEEVQATAALEDYYMEGVQFRQYNREGKLYCVIDADELTHHPQHNQFFFVAPKILINDSEGKRNWEISAERGHSEEGKERIEFNGHVKLIKSADANYPALIITTESLVFDTVKRLASSSGSVKVKEGANLTSAVGVELDFTAEQVKLLSQIFSTYHFER